MDELERQLLQLIEAVKNLAPEIWRIYIKQAQVAGIKNLVWVIVLAIILAFCVWCLLAIKHHMDTKKGEDHYSSTEDIHIGTMIFIGCVGLCAAIALVLCGNAAMGYFVNPEYYAIQALIAGFK